MQSSGWHCRFVCLGIEGRARTAQVLQMYADNQNNAGWQGAYYQIFSMTGRQLFGGTLLEGTVGNHDLCLPVGCSLLKMPLHGSAPEEVSFEVCGFLGRPDSIVRLCIDPVTGQCSAVDVVQELWELAGTSSCDSERLLQPLVLFDFGNSTGSNNFQSSPDRFFKLRISDPLNNSAVIAEHRLLNQFMDTVDLCLPAEGCYDITFETNGSNDARHFQFSMCGQLSNAMKDSSFCLEREHNLCYGLTGCPALVSHGQHSWFQHYFLYTPTNHDTVSISPDTFIAQKVINNGNLHGVHELCEATDGRQYSLLLGAGKQTETSVKFCGDQITLPALVQFTTVNNGTSCSDLKITSGSCKVSGEHPFLFALLDTFGDGWGRSAFTVADLDTGRVVAAGTLEDGQIASSTLCLYPRRTYRLKISEDAYDDEIRWMLCGYVGSGATDLEFDVHEDGTSCIVQGVSGDDYWQTEDDDFPSIDSPPPIVTVSTTPSLIPTTSPDPPPPRNSPTTQPSAHSTPGLLPPDLSDDDDYFVTPKYLSGNKYSEILHTVTQLRLQLHTSAAVSALRPGDVAFIPLALRKILLTGGYDVWNIKLCEFAIYEETQTATSGIASFVLNVVFRVVSL